MTKPNIEITANILSSMAGDTTHNPQNYIKYVTTFD